MPQTPNIHPDHPNAPYELSLSDGVQTFGLKLAADEGVPGLQEDPQRASSLLPGSAGELQAHLPGLLHTEQRSWHGGNSAANWGDAPDGFAHSGGAWTLTPNKLMPAPRWAFAEGIVPAVGHSGAALAWRSVLGAGQYLAVPFMTDSTGLTPTHVHVWLRRQGSPGTLRVALWTDDGAGNPLAAIANASGLATAADLPDTPSAWHGFALSVPPALAASTAYHLMIYADGTPTAANHWAVGVDDKTASAKQSAAGTGWAETDFTPYFRVLENKAGQTYQLFHFQEALYAVVNPADGSAGQLYINGARGMATTTVAQSLKDSNQSWATDVWAGAWVRIVGGTGRGQTREILSNTATKLVVLEDWHETPDSTSEYVIYATPHWAEVAGANFTVPVSGVAVTEDQVFFARKATTFIRKMRYNTATPAHEFADDTKKANRLFVFTDPVHGVQIWRDTSIAKPKISHAPPPAWGANLVFGTVLPLGGSMRPIQHFFALDGQLWVVKPDGFWTVKQEVGVPDQVTALPMGLEHHPLPETGKGLVVDAGRIVLRWGAGLARIEGDTLTPLPVLQAGLVEALRHGGAGRLFALTEGNERTPPTLAMLDGLDGDEGWHPLFQGWEAARSLGGQLHWQAGRGAQSRLWFSVAGELLFIDLPAIGADPADDPLLDFQHEAVVTLPVMDFGMVRAPKFFKSLAVLTAALVGGAHVLVEAQVDDEIGGAFWRNIGAIYRSPEDELPLRLGDAHRIQVRLRLQTGADGQPPQVLAAVLAGFVRTPLKYRWRLHLNLDSHPDPAALLAWLKNAAAEAAPLHLRAIWPDLDGHTVILEPPRITRVRRAPGEWGGRVEVVLKEG